MRNSLTMAVSPRGPRRTEKAPELWALNEVLPKASTDWIPQDISDRLHYGSIYGDDAHYPGAGPNASPLEKARGTALWAEFRKKGRSRCKTMTTKRVERS